MGGGTFDATVIQSTRDGLFVLATEGHNEIGGLAINKLIVDQIVKEVALRTGASAADDANAMARIWKFAEEAKIGLSRPGCGQMEQTIVAAGEAVDILFTRSQLEKLVTPLIEETLKISANCLDGAGLTWQDVDKVQLVGGAARLPMIETMLRRSSGLSKDALFLQQPDQAVAFGAAMVAAQRAGIDHGSKKIQRQVNSNDIGLLILNKETSEPDIEVLLKRNAPLPAKTKRTFYTKKDDQLHMMLNLVQRPSDSAELVSLGQYRIGPFSSPRKNLPVDVSLSCDLEGIFYLSATEPETGKAVSFNTAGDDQLLDGEQLEAQKSLLGSVTLAV